MRIAKTIIIAILFISKGISSDHLEKNRPSRIETQVNTSPFIYKIEPSTGKLKMFSNSHYYAHNTDRNNRENDLAPRIKTSNTQNQAPHTHPLTHQKVYYPISSDNISLLSHSMVTHPQFPDTNGYHPKLKVGISTEVGNLGRNDRTNPNDNHYKHQAYMDRKNDTRIYAEISIPLFTQQSRKRSELDYQIALSNKYDVERNNILDRISKLSLLITQGHNDLKGELIKEKDKLKAFY